MKPTKEQILMFDQSLAYLQDSVHSIANHVLEKACNRLLNNERFRKCPASREKHQAYVGGLVVHTAEVMWLARKLATAHFLEVNRDALITATLFHDSGKLWDYNVTSDEILYTPHRHTIRHLSHSYAEFMKMVTSNFADDEYPDTLDPLQPLVDLIGHCILAHHGRTDWGSPVEPLTVEAMILHSADPLSGRFSKDYYLL